MRSLKFLSKGLVCCAIELAACAHRDAPSASEAAPSSAVAGNDTHAPIELFSWWARVGEWDALGGLRQIHKSHFPNDEILNASAQGSGLARRTLAERMLRGEPPDTFQANIGMDLMRWVVVNGLDSRESKLTPLDDVLPDTAEWRRVMPPAVLKDLSYDGKLYAVPSNIHRLNTIFYNKKLLTEHGIAEPSSVGDLLAAGKKLHEAGIDLFAVGDREPWTLSLFIFENLLVAREGASFYDDYFRGRLQSDDPRVVRTLEQALELLQFANSNQRELSWLQAMDLVVRGRAAMTVMGDWARATLDVTPAGKEIGELAFPGSREAFVYTSDTFCLPSGARNSAGAERLLSTIGSREGQAMIAAKSALPARLDLPPPADPVLLDKFRLLQGGKLALALSGLVPTRFADDLNSALPEMLAQHDIEPVVQTLRTRYALLK